MKKLLLTAILIVSLFYVSAVACTDILAAKQATLDGSVITSHTCDGRYDSRLVVVPAMDHEEGAMAPVYEWIVYADRMDLVKLGEIPQVAHTYQYFNVAYPMANEHQLIIGETTLGGARETANSDKAIMTIEQLEIFALQRTTNARDAIKLIGALAEEYGYRESCWLGECITISDPNEVWVFEVYGTGPLWEPGMGPGAVWAAQRVPDDHITTVVNYSMIGEIDLETNRPPNVSAGDFMISEDYVQVATDLGLYDPASGEPFVWKYIFGDIEGTKSDRLWRVFSVLNPSGNWSLDNTWEYPFSVKPDEKVSVYDIIELYRDVSEGTPYDMGDNEAWYYESGGEMVKSPLASSEPNTPMRNLLGIPYTRTIAKNGCSYYFVSQARDWMPDKIGGLLWFGLDNPRKGAWIPVYVGTLPNTLPESWVTLNRDELDRSCSYWAFDLVDKISNQRLGALMPLIEEVRVPFQTEMFEEQRDLDEMAMTLYEDNPELVLRLLSSYTARKMREAEELWYDLSEVLLTKID
ncbi:dipeptidase [Mesotoga prima MesG1.Ag.4.2]|uniref:Dipeptidase n=1 Tax=Mesotoga prima MesG1.Ag.4.2 TaxID=660470 RepID=I2F6R1_9BACT|nr:C69 family dipeptidase [Mesotoga prima]AFK07614.1 dipeptidase [Mesotoga prima MesG1.Ag.4.2]